MTSVLRHGALIALAVVLSTGMALAGDKEAIDAYKAGVAAVEGGRFREGITSLESALRARAEEGPIRIGVVTHPYLPSRYLAAAWLELGEASKARQALERAEAVKSASKAERTALQQLRQRLDAATSAPPPTPTAAIASPAPTAPAPAPKAACPDIADAEAALKGGDLPRARRLAAVCLSAGDDERARRVMVAVEAEMAGLLTRARREKAAGDVAHAKATIDRVLEIDPGNGEALDLRDAVSLIASSSAPRPSPSAPPPPRPPAPSGASAAPSPSPVEPGIRAYFEGNIGAAVAALEPRAEGTSRVDILTIYACALATQSLVEGDSGQADELASRARAAWQRAKALRPGLALDESTFSPRVRKLLGP